MYLKIIFPDPGELQSWLGRISEAVQLAIRLTALFLWGEVRKEAPVDEGVLAGSFQLQGGGLSWRIVTAVTYALFVHEGRGPVYPVHAKALAIEIGGGVIFRRSAGPAEANPFAERAVATTEGRVAEFLATAIRQMGV